MSEDYIYRPPRVFTEGAGKKKKKFIKLKGKKHPIKTKMGKNSLVNVIVNNFENKSKRRRPNNKNKLGKDPRIYPLNTISGFSGMATVQSASNDFLNKLRAKELQDVKDKLEKAKKQLLLEGPKPAVVNRVENLEDKKESLEEQLAKANEKFIAAHQDIKRLTAENNKKNDEIAKKEADRKEAERVIKEKEEAALKKAIEQDRELKESKLKNVQTKQNEVRKDLAAVMNLDRKYAVGKTGQPYSIANILEAAKKHSTDGRNKFLDNFRMKGTEPTVEDIEETIKKLDKEKGGVATPMRSNENQKKEEVGTPKKLDYEQAADGKKPGDDSLYDYQIEEIMKPFPQFKGVYASDEITKLIPKIKKNEDFGFIMNLDKRSQPGSHWVAAWVSPKNDKTIEYFDSYADEPDGSFGPQIKKVIDHLAPETYLKYKINRIKKQAESSSECGYFAMQFLMDRMEGKPFKDASGFSDVRAGQKGIKKFKSELKSFSFI